MQISTLLSHLPHVSLSGEARGVLAGVAIDSRQVVPGGVFVAVRGVQVDGHAFIEQAISKGATLVIGEEKAPALPAGVLYVQVAHSAEAAGLVAHLFYEEPSMSMKLVGVTGTNGKTTIATLLWKLFQGLGYTCGLISTVENRIGEELIPSTHTTPDAIQLNALLARMRDAGCSHVFMECSSHAIHQHRIAGLQFTGALFSNITHDHLDYHGTFDAYIRAKKSWFDGLPASAFAITNLDDKRGAVMFQNTAAKKFTYSLRTMADFKGRILDNSLQGLHLIINETEVFFRLIGEFNAYNLLAVYGAAICLGESKEDVLLQLSQLTGAEGRFDYVLSEQDRVMGIVDYAHTPDALLNVLATIKKVRQEQERIITVVGCGGDRDKTKRPIMAEVACEHSEQVILTSDNPRTEDPAVILQEMWAGVPITARRKVLTVQDRREAIKTAVTLAQPGDILLIAGKGHEKYQEIQGVKHPFDDKAELEACFQLLQK